MALRRAFSSLGRPLVYQRRTATSLLPITASTFSEESRAKFSSYSQQNKSGRSGFSSWPFLGAGLAVAGAAGFVGSKLWNNESENIWNSCSVSAETESQQQEAESSESCQPEPEPEKPVKIPPPRNISYDEFKGDHDGHVWVTLDGAVFDMTPFLDAHPGGAGRIEMVNGFDLGKFWAVYRLHDRPHIRKLLEDYLIGFLSPEDFDRVSAETIFDDLYSDEPDRDRSRLRVPSDRPWNSEPANLRTLVDSFFTPNDLFFVRNHNPVPLLDEESWRLEIGANPENGIKKEFSFTLKELRELFPRHEVVATLQCAGNRQEDYVTESRPLYVAPHWRNGAIGCARWAGVRVRDILNHCGMDVNGIATGKTQLTNAKIVNFIAADMDETGVTYAGVIPIQKAIDPFGDAILAYEMNGEVLPRDHGWPVRLLAPGHAGCRNVKWVSRVEVAESPSELDAGARLDRHFGPEVSWDAHRHHVAQDRCPEMKDKVCTEKGKNLECKIRLEQGPVIQTLPVQSIVCLPEERSRLSGKECYIPVRGVAWSGGGRGICRVEVSIDGGVNWLAADLIDPPPVKDRAPPEMGMGRNWAWRQFHLNYPLPEELKQKLKNGDVVEIELCSKAIDGDFNSQPQEMSHCWNVLGVCVNHWHKVRVTLDPSLEKGTVLPGPAPPVAGSPYWSDGMCHRCGTYECQPSHWRPKKGEKWPPKK